MSKDKIAKGVAALDRSPSHLLHRAQQAALDIYAEEFGPTGITQRQYAVLAAAADNAGATQTDLVRITGIDRSTLADMAARMIRKGLLERRRSAADARANAVQLTEQGHATLAEARPKMAQADARVLKLLSGGGRRTTFVGLLKDLVQAHETVPAPKPLKAAKAARPGKVTPKIDTKKKKKKAARA